MKKLFLISNFLAIILFCTTNTIAFADDKNDQNHWQQAIKSETVKPTADQSKNFTENEKLKFENARLYCCKICNKGKPCGNSCINRNYTCHKPQGCACFIEFQ